MGDLNRYYLNLYNSDGPEVRIAVMDMMESVIEPYTCDDFSGITNYEKLIYKLQWPTEEEQQAFTKARADCPNMRPILLKGVVIDNQIDNSKGKRCLHIVDASQFKNHEVTDASWLLHLRAVEGVVCSLQVYTFRTDFTYSIPLDTIRPGTRVILSLINLKVASEQYKRITAYCTDVILYDPNSEMTNYEFVDADYRLHGADDYLNLYKSLRDKYLAEKSPESISGSGNEGCYIATAVYGSYDCPEVWTLRRFRDNILARTILGQLFIKFYYSVSPTLVKRFGKTKWFQALWKIFLDKLVTLLQRKGIKSNKYEDNM